MTSPPLTPAEKEQIRRYLGFPNAPAFLEQIEVVSNGLTPMAVTTVRSLLGNIARCEQLIKNTTPYAAETFSSGGAGTRQYAQGQRLQVIKHEARFFISDLSRALNLNIYQDLFPQGQGRLMR